jgi:hypothetical protein
MEVGLLRLPPPLPSLKRAEALTPSVKAEKTPGMEMRLPARAVTGSLAPMQRGVASKKVSDTWW